MRWVPFPSLLLILFTASHGGSAGPFDVGDLPLVEVAPPHRGAPLAIVISGDGGWRAIDRDIAAGLRARGYGVQRILAHYTVEWGPSRVIAVGYSRGAGVLPFMVNRLSPQWRDRVGMLALMGLEPTIDFHVTPFDLLRLQPATEEVPVRSEVEKVGKRILCVYGEREEASLCRALPLSVAIPIAEPGRHHFEVNHDVLARAIWNWSRV